MSVDIESLRRQLAAVADVAEERGYDVQEQRDRAEAAEAQRDRYRSAWQSARQRANWQRIMGSLFRRSCRTWAKRLWATEAERDRLREQIAAVRALADAWEGITARTVPIDALLAALDTSTPATEGGE